VLKTSETDTNAPGFAEEAWTVIDQGRWWQMMVREGSGGFVAGSESMRGERDWSDSVRMDDGCWARLHLMGGLRESPIVGLMCTGPFTSERLDTGGSGEHEYGEPKWLIGGGVSDEVEGEGEWDGSGG
jgi:hypothetical protein